MRHLPVYQVQVISLLIVLVVSRVDHPDAFIDTFCCRSAHVEAMISQRKENKPEMLLPVEELVESNYRQLLAELTEDEDSAVLFDAV